MSKKWDYSELAHMAKLNGGPEKYLDLVKEHSRNAGRLEGKAEGKMEMLVAEGIVAGIGLLGLAGYKAYTTMKEKHEMEKCEKDGGEARNAEECIRKIIDETVKNNDTQHE